MNDRSQAFTSTMMKKIFTALLLSVCFAQAEDKKPKAAPKFPADVRVEQDVSFLGDERKEKADLYIPLEMPKDKRVPAVVIIHGGGFVSGEKNAAREINIGSNLARNGYIGMSIEYVLSVNNSVVWPQNLYDCKTAVRWLRKNADRLNIDPAHIGVIGGSAGGHLTAMVTLTTPDDGLDPKEPYGEFSCKVQCGVDLYGPAEFGSWHDVGMLGKKFAEAPELYRKASPIAYARKDSPPMLLLQGTADKTVDYHQSVIMAEALKKAGAEHELVLVEGAPHTFHLEPKERDLRPLVLGFFDKYLKPKS